MTPEYIMRKSLCREPFCAAGASQSTREAAIEDVTFAAGYAEPGYDSPARGILFGNWNYFPRGLDDILERNEMVAHGHERLLFQIDEVSQFYITFCIWEKVVDEDLDA